MPSLPGTFAGGPTVSLVLNAPGPGRCGSGTRRCPGLRGRRGFTLLEVLMVLALLSLLVGLFSVGAANLLRDDLGPADEEFVKSMEAARKFAVLNNCEVRLSFDGEEKVILLHAVPTGGLGLVPAGSFPLREEGEAVIDLLVAQGGRAILVGGQVVETTTVPAVSFYADGTCSAFRVQFRLEGRVSTLDVDPWTCAPVIPEPAGGGA